MSEATLTAVSRERDPTHAIIVRYRTPGVAKVCTRYPRSSTWRAWAYPDAAGVTYPVRLHTSVARRARSRWKPRAIFPVPFDDGESMIIVGTWPADWRPQDNNEISYCRHTIRSTGIADAARVIPHDTSPSVSTFTFPSRLAHPRAIGGRRARKTVIKPNAIVFYHLFPLPLRWNPDRFAEAAAVRYTIILRVRARRRRRTPRRRASARATNRRRPCACVRACVRACVLAVGPSYALLCSPCVVCVCACARLSAVYRVPYWYARWCATTREPPRCIVLPVYRSCTVRSRRRRRRRCRRTPLLLPLPTDNAAHDVYTRPPTDDGRRCTTFPATAAAGVFLGRLTEWYERPSAATTTST